MFKIKCGDKYFKKVYLGDEIDNILMEKYADSNGEISGKMFGKFRFDYKMYPLGTGGSTCSIQLVSDISDASLFDDCDDRGLESRGWFRRLEEEFDVEFIDIEYT